MTARNSGLSLRARAVTRQPDFDRRRTMLSPMPRLPPVTMTLRMRSNQLSRLRDGEGGDEADRCRDLVRRQRLAAETLDDLSQIARLIAFGQRRIARNHVRRHERSGDRALLRLYQRQPHLRMAVENGFDLLGMHFQAA